MHADAMSRLNYAGNPLINRTYVRIHGEDYGAILSGYRAFTRNSFDPFFLSAKGFGIEAAPKREGNTGTARKWRYFLCWHMIRHLDLPEHVRSRHEATAREQIIITTNEPWRATLAHRADNKCHRNPSAVVIPFYK